MVTVEFARPHSRSSPASPILDEAKGTAPIEQGGAVHLLNSHAIPMSPRITTATAAA